MFQLCRQTRTMFSTSAASTAAASGVKTRRMSKIHRQALHTDQAPAAVGPYSQG